LVVKVWCIEFLVLTKRKHFLNACEIVLVQLNFMEIGDIYAPAALLQEKTCQCPLCRSLSGLRGVVENYHDEWYVDGTG
jgi:hypothetical protein